MKLEFTVWADSILIPDKFIMCEIEADTLTPSQMNSFQGILTPIIDDTCREDTHMMWEVRNGIISFASEYYAHKYERLTVGIKEKFDEWGIPCHIKDYPCRNEDLPSTHIYSEDLLLTSGDRVLRIY